MLAVIFVCDTDFKVNLKNDSLKWQIWSWQLETLGTWNTARMVSNTQRRVRPLLTEPPSRDSNVCPLMLNDERTNFTVFSNTMTIYMVSLGDAWTNLEENIFCVQGVLHPNLLLWKYNGLNRLSTVLSFAIEKLNFLLHIFWGSCSKIGGTHPISFLNVSNNSFWAHIL